MNYSLAAQISPSKILGEDVSHSRLLLGAEQSGDRRLETVRAGSLADKVGRETGVVVPAVLAEGDQDGGVRQGLLVLRTIVIDFPIEWHDHDNCLGDKGGEDISKKWQAQLEGENRDGDELAVEPQVDSHLGGVAHSLVLLH